MRADPPDPETSEARRIAEPWMTAPATVAVMDALEAAGGPGSARFVGGCVRNAVLGLPVDDIDVATSLRPDEASSALRAAKLKVVPTGVEHGTVTAISGRKPFEITTLRRDVSTDGRRAVVAFTDDWTEDARRRDFRLNSLYADRSGRLFDPTGHGVEDALAGRIVFVGRAVERIAEDVLRILRFFRFYAWFGRGEPDAEALAACIEQRTSLASLSAERVQKELLKLLQAVDPMPATRLMARAGVLAEVLPGAGSLDRLAGLVALDRIEGRPPDALLRLAALVAADRGDAAQTAGRLRLSNAQRERLLALADEGPVPDPAMTLPGARRAIYALGPQAFNDRLRLARAAAPAGQDAADWRALEALAESWRPPPFPLSGADVMARGVPEGPRVGEVLKALEAGWIEGDFTADRQALLDRLGAMS